MTKPVAEACLRNQHAIFEVLASYLDGTPRRLFEIGSGTGQHAVYVADRMPHLQWQPSELPEMIEAIDLWAQEAVHQNVLPPVALDVNHPHSLADQYDVVFSANTLHFVSALTALKLLQQAANLLKNSGLLFIYGPFNDAGQYTSEGNRRLDQWLKQRDPDSGIKDLEWVLNHARDLGMHLLKSLNMPANNITLVFEKDGE